MLIPHVILWNIWRERNRLLLGGVGTPLQRIKNNVIDALFPWEPGNVYCSSFDVIDFVDRFYFGCAEHFL